MFLSLIMTSVSALVAVHFMTKRQMLKGAISTLVACFFTTLYCVALNPEILLNGLMALTVFGFLLATALWALYAQMMTNR